MLLFLPVLENELNSQSRNSQSHDALAHCSAQVTFADHFILYYTILYYTILYYTTRRWIECYSTHTESGKLPKGIGVHCYISSNLLIL